MPATVPTVKLAALQELGLPATGTPLGNRLSGSGESGMVIMHVRACVKLVMNMKPSEHTFASGRTTTTVTLMTLNVIFLR